jgi:hypothetical protein
LEVRTDQRVISDLERARSVDLASYQIDLDGHINYGLKFRSRLKGRIRERLLLTFVVPRSTQSLKS